MSYEISGIIHDIFPAQTFGNNGFIKREFVLEIQNGDYTNYVKFETTKDRTTLLDRCKPGDEVTVKFGVTGRKWEGNNGISYFNA